MSTLAAGVSDSLSLSGSQIGFAAVIGVIAILALGVAYLLMREVLAADAGTPRMREIAHGRPGRSGGLPGPAGEDAGRLCRHHSADPAGSSGGQPRLPHRPVDLLHHRRWRLLRGRLLRHGPRGARQRPRRGGRPEPGRASGDADRVPHRRRRRHAHGRPRPAGRLARRDHLPQGRAAGPGGLRLRRRPARHVHACRRRHLHQGCRRRRRPRRQGRGRYPGGRPA